MTTVIIAIALGLLILLVGFSTLRGLTQPPGRVHKPSEAEPPPAEVRITFWCENCGTEVLLLRQGAETSPRHCGEPMIRREEIARD